MTGHPMYGLSNRLFLVSCCSEPWFSRFFSFWCWLLWTAGVTNEFYFFDIVWKWITETAIMVSTIIAGDSLSEGDAGSASIGLKVFDGDPPVDKFRQRIEEVADDLRCPCSQTRRRLRNRTDRCFLTNDGAVGRLNCVDTRLESVV